MYKSISIVYYNIKTVIHGENMKILFEETRESRGWIYKQTKISMEGELMKKCRVCGRSSGVELHHIVKRSQCRAMIKAPINHVCLCPEHHRGTKGVHGREGHALDIQLKLALQKELFKLFNKEYYHKDEIEQLLRIDRKDVDMLLKTLRWQQEGYEKIEVVRMCMGGILYSK